MKQQTRTETPNGILVVDKPSGITSHDVVSRLRKILQTKKIGHTGTLDPFATGVLVMLVGKATRLAKFLDKDDKCYQAIMRFGYRTDTGDRDGKPVGVEPVKERLADPGMLAFVTGLRNLPSKVELLRRLETVLPEFSGSIEQIPPMYSAKKKDGKRLYEMAREGITIEREPVSITVHEISILDSDLCAENELLLKVCCSAGTYVRTLAEDIGTAIGTPCHLAELRRVSAGSFSLESAVDLENLSRDDAVSSISPMSKAVKHLRKQTVVSRDIERISNGMKIAASEDFGGVHYVALIDESENLIAIGEPSGSEEIQPRTVFT